MTKNQKINFGEHSYLDKKIHENSKKEIILNHDIYLENYEMDYYEGGIELDVDGLVIEGNGNMIDGKGKSRIFIITGNNITLKNIIFKNGYAHKNYDNLLNSSGGALLINHNIKLNVINCKFINNSSEDDGGAIDNKGELTIQKSAFNQNMAGHYGGAITNRSKLTIIDSSIMGNKCPQKNQCGGGAILNFRGDLTIRESLINGNAGEMGGAIYNQDGDLTITESTFTNNTTNRGDGGAIYNYGELTITKTTLNNNTARENGGAICNSASELIITSSKLNENVANFNGGAIYNAYGCLTISNSTLNENTANFNGGAICNYKKRLFNIENCKVENNNPNDIV